MERLRETMYVRKFKMLYIKPKVLYIISLVYYVSKGSSFEKWVIVERWTKTMFELKPKSRILSSWCITFPRAGILKNELS